MSRTPGSTCIGLATGRESSLVAFGGATAPPREPGAERGPAVGESQQPPTRNWRPWLRFLVIACSLSIASLLLSPWISSAYHLERAGRILASDDLSEESYLAAGRALQQAIHMDPSNARAYWLLAQAHRQQGHLPAAVDALAQVVSLKPKDRLALLTLAESCEQLAVTELAVTSSGACGYDQQTRVARLVELWQRAGQSAVDILPAADAYREQGNWTEASALYERALLLEPSSPEAWYGLGSAHEAQGRPEEAMEAYARTAALSQDSELVAAAHASRAQIMADANRWSEASAEMAQAVRLMPRKGAYHLDYGWYSFRAGDPQQDAREELVTAASLMPDSPWPPIHLANLSFADENFVESLEYGERAVALAPGLFWAWVWQGKALARLERPVEAERSLRQAIALAPAEATPYDELGKLLEEEGQLDAAIAQYESAVRLAPGNLWYNLSLAQAYRSNGQAEEAREVFLRVLELDPGNTTAGRALEEIEP